MLRRFLINNFKNHFQRELREKNSKKGLLAKVIKNNKKNTNCLVEILKDSDHLNTFKNSFYQTTEDEILLKFRNTNKNSQKFSISSNRTNYLSNFLRKFIINVIQSNYFENLDFSNDNFFLEISNIQIMSDLSSIKIFWVTSENEKQNIYVENYLENNVKYKIRSVLFSEKVINFVPKILFIRDESNMLYDQIRLYLSNKNFDGKSNHEEISGVKQSNTINDLYGINTDNMIEKIKNNTEHKIKNYKDHSINQPSNKIIIRNSLKINEYVKGQRKNKFFLEKFSKFK